MQIVEIFSTDQQLSGGAGGGGGQQPPHPQPTAHLSCCCDWFCLMELERGNNFIELDFNMQEKERGGDGEYERGKQSLAQKREPRYFLIFFPFFSLSLSLCHLCLIEPLAHALSFWPTVEHNTIRWSLKGTRALKHVTTEARFTAWRYRRAFVFIFSV